MAIELQSFVSLLSTYLNLNLLMMLPCTPPRLSSLEPITRKFTSCKSQWGLTVGIHKIKAMAINPPESLSLFPNVSVRVVDEFPYHGSVISGSGSIDKRFLHGYQRLLKRLVVCSTPSFCASISKSPPNESYIGRWSFLLCCTALRRGL